MRKLRLGLVYAFLCSMLVFGICACQNTTPPNNTALQTFTDVSLANAECTYDGQPHSLTVSGNIPPETNIVYEGNGQTDAGVYTVKATLTKDNYQTKTLSATLTVHKAEFTDVSLEDKKFIYWGKPYSLAVEGNIPAHTQITYDNNDQKEVGVYTVTATLTNPNYVTKTLTATLTITAKTDIARSIIDSLLVKPDPWDFLPEAFAPSRMANSQMPVGGMENFATDVQVTNIVKRSIGKQFHVLYEGLCDATSAIDKLDSLFAIGAALADAYQTYINNSPDGYATFSGEVGGFKVKIMLDDDKSTLLAGNAAVNIELHYDAESETRVGRVQLTEGLAIKYTADDYSLRFAVKTTINNIGNLKQIEFERTQSAVAGYLREFTGTETKNLKTTGVIASDAQYTVIMSDKRETEDLLIKGYEEVYSSVTGDYLGGRVQETVKLVDYDTLWLHLGDVQGFQSVRVEDAKNGLNLDSVYINGQNTVFATKKVNPILPTSSRRFDVEMKEVWYIVAETSDDKTEYKSIKTLIPMLFVQTKQTDSFAADVKEKNAYMPDVALPMPQISTVNSHYDSMKRLFDTAKDITFADIQAYIGDKNEFFDKSA